MCFSATACFTAGALLVPAGAYTLARSWQHDRRFLALASFPLLFGIQQLFEGTLWLNLEGNTAIDGNLMALGFLFFAYLLWPFYVPLAALLVEPQRHRARLFTLFTLLGLILGTTLYIPLLFNPEWLTYTLVKGSILYEPVLIYDGILSRTVLRVIYAVIVAVPLLFSSVSSVRFFGVLIFTSVAISALFFAYAFVSIWCFFAALLSAYILYLVRKEAVAAGQP